MDELITDPEWVTTKYMKVAKYNRTATSLKGVLNIMRDFPDNIRVCVTYILLFPKILLFIPFNFLLCHTQYNTNIIDILPLRSKPTILMHSKDK
jgi:hypothetical protein